MGKYKVLSTKKLELSLIEQANGNDIEIREQEFISIKPVRNAEITKAMPDFAKQKENYIALTSANAVDVLNNYLAANNTYSINDWRVFCLSGNTKKAIQNAGFPEENIIGEARTASELAQKVIQLAVNEITLFCGNKRREELPLILKAAKIKVHEVVLYETLEVPTTITEDFDAILFFSPSGVQSFFLANRLADKTICFAIGDTTATSIAAFSNKEVVISVGPSPKMMMEKVIQHFGHKSAVK